MDSSEDLRNATEDDYLIVCGDFGCVWHGNLMDDILLDYLAAKPYTILFVDGNHENFEALYRYPVETWHGGRVHRIRPSVFHLMRGEVFNIDGKSFFTMGGACSTDKQLRIDHISWWQEELPNYAECQHAMDTLDGIGWKVDYVITHTAPTSVLGELNPSFEPDTVTNFLEEISGRLSFTHWYFGHFHMMTNVGEKFTCLYENIIAMNGKEHDG